MIDYIIVSKYIFRYTYPIDEFVFEMKHKEKIIEII